jgi:putative membrane protein
MGVFTWRTAMTSPSVKPLDAGTRLAVDRTRLAYERTLMAWVRTATSLISFGFTIYKFFQLELKDQPAHAEPMIGARGFALIMIATGLVALALSTFEHRRSLQAMREEFGHIPGSTAAIVAGLISLLGILAFVAVAVRS